MGYPTIRIFVKRKQEYEYMCSTDKYDTTDKALKAYVEKFPRDVGNAKAFFKDETFGYIMPKDIK